VRCSGWGLEGGWSESSRVRVVVVGELDTGNVCTVTVTVTKGPLGTTGH
jgi:hypothetical protein